MSLHWSVVVVLCVALVVVGALAALHLVDPSRVVEVALGVVLWLSKSPLVGDPPAGRLPKDVL